mgnify:CR=1 FL=1
MKKIKILLGIAMVVSVLTIPVHGAEEIQQYQSYQRFLK